MMLNNESRQVLIAFVSHFPVSVLSLSFSFDFFFAFSYLFHEIRYLWFLVNLTALSSVLLRANDESHELMGNLHLNLSFDAISPWRPDALLSCFCFYWKINSSWISSCFFPSYLLNFHHQVSWSLRIWKSHPVYRSIVPPFSIVSSGNG